MYTPELRSDYHILTPSKKFPTFSFPSPNIFRTSNNTPNETIPMFTNDEIKAALDFMDAHDECDYQIREIDNEILAMVQFCNVEEMEKVRDRTKPERAEWIDKKSKIAPLSGADHLCMRYLKRKTGWSPLRMPGLSLWMSTKLNVTIPREDFIDQPPAQH